MRIFLISNMYPSKEAPSFGVFVKNFEDGISREGGLITRRALIIGRSGSKLVKLRKYLSFYLETLKGLFSKDYDIIYVHYVLHSAFLLYFFLPFVKKPIVLNAHGDDVQPQGRLHKWLLKNLIKPVAKKSSCFVVPSKYYKSVVQNIFNLPAEKMYVYPSGGINTEVFKPFESGQTYSFGYASRIDKGKGWDTFIEALNIIKQSHPQLNWTVLMVGDGAQSSEKDNLIANYKLGKHITTIQTVPQAQLAACFNQMECFVFPTRRLTESLGLVGLEAMACGVPVIGSDIGGLKDYIEDGKNGYLFDPNNPQSLAEKMLKYIHLEKSEQATIAWNASQKAQEFESKKVTHELYLTLNQLASRYN
ncbi:glycosyltransferase involved in cell wall biosynthesis [Chitinophaga skermanii]|uniref:Glycosyltransferase involved in cell wall biosynthesis n=1 Tax=Chitinophaga skermanii TaxID=331697 RepID=A0A327R1K9_9BACT|nr:glycosyltransferase family 4 protein [Chitinophaga skermanii]RAJ10521.1 glycosyltransferase involved in cell wall biosynthesis [Chitinophaga skermanii]